MGTLFVVGSLWFWVLLAVFVIAETICANVNSNSGAFVTLGIFLGLLYIGGAANVARWAYDNPKAVVLGLIAYLIIGTVWSLFKWTLFCSEIAAYFRGFKKNDVNRISYNLGGIYISRYSLPLQAGKYKDLIVTWMLWWPFSALWSLIDDFATKVFTAIYNNIQEVYQWISNRSFKDFPPQGDLED